MKLDDTVMVQFFGELIESYRQQIMDQEEARELSKKEKKFLADLRKELELSNPQAYRMVTELFGCMLDISQIKQEQLYIQGIKDGIRIRKLVKESRKVRNVKKGTDRTAEGKISCGYRGQAGADGRGTPDAVRHGGKSNWCG